MVLIIDVCLRALARNELSRVRAAALSTVLRTTTLSCGNIRNSGTRQTENAKPINMNFAELIRLRVRPHSMYRTYNIVGISLLTAVPHVSETYALALFILHRILLNLFICMLLQIRLIN
jgi:hypothetical protein